MLLLLLLCVLEQPCVVMSWVAHSQTQETVVGQDVPSATSWAGGSWTWAAVWELCSLVALSGPLLTLFYAICSLSCLQDFSAHFPWFPNIFFVFPV